MNPPPPRTWLLAVLGLAVILRAWLALQGGQLSLLGGYARPRAMPGGIGLLLAAAAWNIAPHFSIEFPDEVRLKFWRNYGVPKFSLTYYGTGADPVWPPETRPDLVLVDTVRLYPVRNTLPPAGEVVAEWRHPHSVPACQYEAHTPRERRLLRHHPPLIRLLQPDQPGTLPDHPSPDILGQPGDLPDGYVGGAAS